MKLMHFVFIIFYQFFSTQNTAVMEINYETILISDSLTRNKTTLYNSTLLCNNTESVYFSREAQSFYNGTSKKTVNTNLGAIAKYPKSVGSVYKAQDKLLVSLPIGRYIFTYEEPKLDWKVLDEIKDVKGFKCQLARADSDTGDTFFAWFTKDISIPDGPFRFKGLSGMVLEVYNKNKTIQIFATEIKKSDEKIEPLNYGNDVKTKSKQQFLEARNNYFQNPSMYNGNIKVLDSNGNDKTKIMTDRLKKTNTFLD